MATVLSRSRPSRRSSARRGVITIWTILCLPLLLTILFAVAEVGRMWQARVQLENALEAAALAAVQEWGDRGGGQKHLAAAFAAGRAYAEANAVHGMPVRLGNRQAVPSVAWSFGTATPEVGGYEFTPTTDADARFAVVLQASVKVPRLCRAVFGAKLGEVTVTATTAAFYDPRSKPRQPKLIRLAKGLAKGTGVVFHVGDNGLRQSTSSSPTWKTTPVPFPQDVVRHVENVPHANAPLA